MEITKRNGNKEKYDVSKIKNALVKACRSVNSSLTSLEIDHCVELVEEKIKNQSDLNVEQIQDMVEKTLMEENHYEEMKSYILYREAKNQKRKSRYKLLQEFEELGEDFEKLLLKIQKDYQDECYDLELLNAKFETFYKEDMNLDDRFRMLIKAAVELTTQEASRWEMIAGRLYYYDFRRHLKQNEETSRLSSFYEKVVYLTQQGLYGSYILETYSKEEIEICASYMDSSRDELINYAGFELLIHRYLIKDGKGNPLESVQEMFLGIAMHLALKEQNRLEWVKEFYDMLSKLQVTMATPTIANARKPFNQLSSCFIDTVPDSLNGIYRSIDNFAKVSKYGGGMGLYFGKVRASGSSIRGVEGASGGVIRWIRLANDTAVAVDQLGVRAGAVAVYLDAWHRDLPEFLALRTNNGDDRMKAHDVFPAICYPDYFWRMAKENINGNWALMCPHDIYLHKGYHLEDYYGKQWEERYLDCVNDKNITKRIIPIKDLIRLIIKSVVETGTPFTFNRDAVNRTNPNKHKGMIYCSNLCTEIAQNMSEIEEVSEEMITVDGETVVINTTKPGDFVVCNLASLSLGRINVDDPGEIEKITRSAVRAMDNVIDLNFFPVPYAKITSMKYRPVGLGVSGYHHMLATHHIKWESNEHLEFVDRVFSDIAYYAIKASSDIAKEKGSYAYFEGSGWQTGDYFKSNGLTDERFVALHEYVQKNGLRNGYLMAIAPTSSTSVIAATTPGVDPIMKRYFLEEKKNGLIPRVAPELAMNNYWYYKNAHLIDQTWSIKACGLRQKYIDQSQSMNLYITNDYTFRQILNLFILAYENHVKTIYYFRSQSLETKECESCAS